MTIPWPPKSGCTGGHDDRHPAMKPKRIQLSRVKGARKPEGAINCARPTKWGNPYSVPHDCKGESRTQQIAAAVHLYGVFINGNTSRAKALRACLHELKGHDLACWCPLDGPCHLDILLKLANKVTA